MVCKKCNAQLPDNVRFCSYCGEKVETETNLHSVQGNLQQSVAEARKVTNSKDESKKAATQKKVINAGKIVLGFAIVAIAGWSLVKGLNNTKTSDTKLVQSKSGQEVDVSEVPTVAPTPTPISFENKVLKINQSGNAMAVIDIYEENYSVREAVEGDYWDKDLFYELEDIDKKSDKDGILNTYNIEAKTLKNKETGNKIDYILYRNPHTNAVNKIVSMEYLENGEIETVDYYFTDEGKINFIFFHTVTEYTPSYATRNKPGERYYFDDDAMVKWRVTTKNKKGDVKELNYIATKKEWGDQEECPWWSMLEDTTPEIQEQFKANAVRMLNAAYNTYHAVVNAESINMIEGYVIDEYDEVVAGATVRLFAENKEKCLFECLTDENGRYRLYIPSDAYIYRLEIAKQGFLSEIIYGIEPTGEIVELIQENVCLFRNGEGGSMYFTLRHAFMDEYLDEATIYIRRGINNRSGEIYDTLNYNVDEDTGIILDPGNYTLEIKMSGYQTAYKNIRFSLDNCITILLSPNLNDGEVRIVLDWGYYPNDLDSHLFTPYNGEKSEEFYHIWYGNDRDPYGNNLDVDDTDGYGPETMTIRDLKNGCYKYYVADFTHCMEGDPTSYEMSESGAQVNVYTSEGDVQTFYVPTNRSGVIWEVFEIRNGRINRINHYYNQIEDKEWWHQEK